MLSISSLAGMLMGAYSNIIGVNNQSLKGIFFTHLTSVYFLSALVLLHLNEDFVLLVLLLHLPTIRATHDFQSFIKCLVSDLEILLVGDHINIVDTGAPDNSR